MGLEHLLTVRYRLCLRLNLAEHTSEDSEFRVFCKQAFVFQGHFDEVDCVFTHPQSLADDASVDSDNDCDSDGVDNCDDDAVDSEHEND
jgi:hypothetical protein